MWGRRKRKMEARLYAIRKEQELTSKQTEMENLRSIVAHIEGLARKARDECVTQISKELMSYGCEVTIIVHPLKHGGPNGH